MRVELFRMASEPVTIEVEGDEATVKQVLSAPGSGKVLGEPERTLLDVAGERYGRGRGARQPAGERLGGDAGERGPRGPDDLADPEGRGRPLVAEDGGRNRSGPVARSSLPALSSCIGTRCVQQPSASTYTRPERMSHGCGPDCVLSAVRQYPQEGPSCGVP